MYQKTLLYALLSLAFKIVESLQCILNTNVQIALLRQLTSSNSSLLMHPILVQINGLKYNFGKQKSIWLVKMFA